MILRRRRAASGSCTDGDRLAEAARGGDEAALAALRADLAPEALVALAAVLGLEDPDAVAVLTAARALAAVPGDHAAREALGQVVVLLLDGGGRSAAAVSELLDLPVVALVAARAAALALSGPQAPAPGCRGWPLVAGGDRLTPEERAAAEAHLGSCRRCTAARAAAAQALRRGPSVPSQRTARG